MKKLNSELKCYSLNEVVEPEKKVASIIITFINKILSKCLYCKLIDEVEISNKKIIGSVLIIFSIKIKIKRHPYMLMIVKGIKKMIEDFGYYASKLKRYELKAVSLQVKIPEDSFMTFSKNRIVYKQQDKPACDIDETKATEILNLLKHKRFVDADVLLFYSKYKF